MLYPLFEGQLMVLQIRKGWEGCYWFIYPFTSEQASFSLVMGLLGLGSSGLTWSLCGIYWLWFLGKEPTVFGV